MAVAILPCAGSSWRMGRPKLLLPFRGETVLGSLISALRDGGITELVVVVHHADHDLLDWCSRRGIDSTVNPNPQRGMLSSIWEGLSFFGGAEEFKRRGEDLLVCPGDHPDIRPSSVRRLLARLQAMGAGLVVPTSHGKRGHPILVSTDLVHHIEQLAPDRGLKALLERYPHRVFEGEVDDTATVRDIDTPADYEKLLKDP